MGKNIFVLSGGGAKGSFQVGVMKRLASQGIFPDALIGTSVGALNAAAVAHVGLSELEAIWMKVRKRSDILKLNWWKIFWASGIYSTKPLKKTLDKYLTKDSTTEAIACCVDLNDGAIKYFSNQDIELKDFRTAVQASSAIPGIMEPVGSLIDGGAREMIPLKEALRRYSSHDTYHVILTNPVVENPIDLYDIKKESSFLKFLHIAYRTIDGIMEHEIFVNDLHAVTHASDKTKVKVYAPMGKLPLSTLDFEQEKILQALDLGENGQIWQE